MIAKLILLLGVLAFVLAYPRIAPMVAVVAATGTALAVRWLLANRTVFQVGRWSYA